MRGVLRPALWAVAGTAVLSLAACNKGAQTISPDEQAIRDLDAKAATLINNKDAVGAAALYAENGGVYAPNAPPAIGNEAVVATLTTLTQTPGFQLEIHPSKITISTAKDMAIDVGTYTLKTGDVNAPDVERGKYVTTWLKLNNEWKMYTDMFSSDTAPAPAAAGAQATMAVPEAPSAAPAPAAADTADTSASAPAAAATSEPGAPSGASAPTSPADEAPAPAAPSGDEQSAPPVPVQQFGPASPVENAAPLMPTGPHSPAQSGTSTAPPADSSMTPPAPQ